MMKHLQLKKVVLTLFLVVSVLTGKSQVTLFNEDWTSNSFSANGWSFPFGQSNWDVGSSYTPFSWMNAPNAYFNWSPSVQNYTYSLLSPTINATGYPGQNLTLSFNLQLSNFSSSTLEEFMVEYKDVASSTWTLLASFSNATVVGTQDYSMTALPLTGMGGQNFEIRFSAFGQDSYNINGWGLDDIIVEAPSCPSIAPTLGISTTTTSICQGSSINLNASGANTYTWLPGLQNGNVLVDSPTANTTYTLTGSVTGCTIVPVDAVITINTLTSPTVAMSGVTNLCQGQSGTISATGAPNYAWSPSTGLSSTTGSLVTANPNLTTTYTIVGTESNGCTDTVTHVLNINFSPNLTASGSPTAICGGGNAQLNSLAVLTTSYVVSLVPHDTIPAPMSGVTVLADNGNDLVNLTNGSLDDGNWENISLPFGFSFFGTTYNQVAINTNGHIYMGPVANTIWGYGNMFPDPFAAAPSIGAIYSDLNFSNTGRIEYFTVGSAPTRTFVVNYKNGDYFWSSGNVDVQVKMMESTNIIEVHTTDATGDNQAVEGIQDATGTTAFTVPGRNLTYYTVTTASPDGYQFAPAGTPSYSWSPSTFLSSTSVSSPTAVNITSSTVYTVTATINGCSTTQSVSIAAGAAVPQLTASINPGINCDGTRTVNITTAMSGAVNAYNWDNGATTSSIAVSPTVTTTYTVVGTNTTGCTVTTTVSVPVGPSPLIVAVASTNTICAGNSVMLNVAGASTYTWSNGASTAMTSVSPTLSTTYTVVGTAANGCTDTTFVPVTVNAVPLVNLAAADYTACINSGTIALSGTPNTGTFVGTNVSQGFFTPGAVAGTFNPMYTVSNASGCSSTASITIVVSSCVGIEENSKAFNNLSVYPNPSNGVFVIALDNLMSKTVEILDLTGRVVSKIESESTQVEVNISSLTNGVYFAKISSGKAVQMVKVVKQ